MDNKEVNRENERKRASRRDFLRKSAYAAAATPLITSMLVEKANAAKSWNSGRGTITDTPASGPASGPVGPNNR